MYRTALCLTLRLGHRAKCDGHYCHDHSSPSATYVHGSANQTILFSRGKGTDVCIFDWLTNVHTITNSKKGQSGFLAARCTSRLKYRRRTISASWRQHKRISSLLGLTLRQCCLRNTFTIRTSFLAPSRSHSTLSSNQQPYTEFTRPGRKFSRKSL